MLESSTLAIFALPAFMLLLIPGPAVSYIIGQGIRQGRANALVSVLGVQAGGATHIVAATLGLAPILMSSPFMFATVRFLGVAYLFCLGLGNLVWQHDPLAIAAGREPCLVRSFVQGAVMNILNPGTLLFYFSFLPQYVEPDQGSIAMQILVLGLISMAIAALIEGAYALLAGAIGARSSANARFFRIQAYVTSGIYLALGTVAAITA